MKAIIGDRVRVHEGAVGVYDIHFGQVGTVDRFGSLKDSVFIKMNDGEDILLWAEEYTVVKKGKLAKKVKNIKTNQTVRVYSTGIAKRYFGRVGEVVGVSKYGTSKNLYMVKMLDRKIPVIVSKSDLVVI
jgi:hypothetical protein